MIILSWLLILPACSVIMGLLGFWIGRCARKLPFIDDKLPWTIHRSQIPAATEDHVKSSPGTGGWPLGILNAIIHLLAQS
jgi:hypothetical protein